MKKLSFGSKDSGILVTPSFPENRGSFLLEPSIGSHNSGFNPATLKEHSSSKDSAERFDMK